MHSTLCSAQQLLHSVTITPVPLPQALQKAPRKAPAFNGFHGKDQSNKKRDLLPLFTLHDFRLSEKKMKKLMKSFEDSFEYTQRSNEFEKIHNTPEK